MKGEKDTFLRRKRDNTKEEKYILWKEKMWYYKRRKRDIMKEEKDTFKRRERDIMKGETKILRKEKKRYYERQKRYIL